jgi:hypothetical protein
LFSEQIELVEFRDPRKQFGKDAKGGSHRQGKAWPQRIGDVHQGAAFHQAQSNLPALDLPRVFACPYEPGVEFPARVVFVLMLYRFEGAGVEGDACAREVACDLCQRCLDLLLCQVDEYRLRDEAVRSGAQAHRGHPTRIENRTGQSHAPLAIGEEPPPQLDDVRKVKVEPMHGAVVEPFEAGVESGADLDHGAFGMVAQKILDPLVKYRGPQDTTHDPPSLVESPEIPIEGFDHLDGLWISQDRMLSLGLGRAEIERNQHRLLHLAQLEGLCLCHVHLIITSNSARLKGDWPGFPFWLPASSYSIAGRQLLILKSAGFWSFSGSRLLAPPKASLYALRI